jgi:hypothetical protein
MSFFFFPFNFSLFLQLRYHRQHKPSCAQAIHPYTYTGDQKEVLYNLFAAYVHTVPLEQLIENVERTR